MKQFILSSHNNVGVCFQVGLSLAIVVPQSTNCLETTRAVSAEIGVCKCQQSNLNLIAVVKTEVTLFMRTRVRIKSVTPYF